MALEARFKSRGLVRDGWIPGADDWRGGATRRSGDVLDPLLRADRPTSQARSVGGPAALRRGCAGQARVHRRRPERRLQAARDQGANRRGRRPRRADALALEPEARRGRGAPRAHQGDEGVARSRAGMWLRDPCGVRPLPGTWRAAPGRRPGAASRPGGRQGLSPAARGLNPAHCRLPPLMLGTSFDCPECRADGSHRRPVDAETTVQPLAYSSAARCSNSNPTNRSSPTTHASWPGSMTYASPGPISTSVPSSCWTPIRPEWATPTWRAWQLSVPATGLTHSDHRHPGSNANRAAVVCPMRTTRAERSFDPEWVRSPSLPEHVVWSPLNGDQLSRVPMCLRAGQRMLERELSAVWHSRSA